MGYAVGSAFRFVVWIIGKGSDLVDEFSGALVGDIRGPFTPTQRVVPK